MLQTLIQTIANLGFDAQAVEATFNEIIATIQTGDMTSFSFNFHRDKRRGYIGCCFISCFKCC